MTEPARVVRPYHERMAAYQRVLETRSPQTTPERLRELSDDPVDPVRLWTARNRRTPPDALARLLQDPNDSVQWNALLNPGAPDYALELLCAEEHVRYGDRHFTLRSLVVHHPNTAADLRRRLIEQGACGCPNWCAGSTSYQPITS